MARRTDSPASPTASGAARVVALLADPSQRGVEALAAQHRARRRPARPSATQASRAERQAPRAERQASPPATPTPGIHGVDEPLPPVLEVFLRELPAPAAASLRAVCADLGAARSGEPLRASRDRARPPAEAAGVPDARLSMLLFDVARRYVPRVLGALGETELALALLSVADPSPDPRDPFLYTKAAAKVGGDAGVAARAFEEQRALIRRGRGDRALARRLLSTLAGRLVARAAEVLGPQVHADVAREVIEALAATEGAGRAGARCARGPGAGPPATRGAAESSGPAPQRRAPVRRDQTAALRPGRPASKTG